MDFISDLRPSGSSRQLLARADQSRPDAPHGIYGEVTTAAGDTISPHDRPQAAIRKEIKHTQVSRRKPVERTLDR